MQDCCFTCKNLEYRKNYVKYEEADLDDYCSRGEKKGATNERTAV